MSSKTDIQPLLVPAHPAKPLAALDFPLPVKADPSVHASTTNLAAAELQLQSSGLSAEDKQFISAIRAQFIAQAASSDDPEAGVSRASDSSWLWGMAPGYLVPFQESWGFSPGALHGSEVHCDDPLVVVGEAGKPLDPLMGKAEKLHDLVVGEAAKPKLMGKAEKPLVSVSPSIRSLVLLEEGGRKASPPVGAPKEKVSDIFPRAQSRLDS
jgi:hypothetical protein